MESCIRVVTNSQFLCSEKELIQKDANFDIISTNAIHKTSKLAKEGNYRGAQSNALAWKKMIKNNAVSISNAMDNYRIFSNNMNDFNNNMQEVQYQQFSQPMINNNIGVSPSVNNQMRSDKLSSQIHSMNNMSNTRSVNNYAKKKK